MLSLFLYAVKVSDKLNINDIRGFIALETMQVSWMAFALLELMLIKVLFRQQITWLGIIFSTPKIPYSSKARYSSPSDYHSLGWWVKQVLQPSVGLLFYSKSNDDRQAKQVWPRQTADILLHFFTTLFTSLTRCWTSPLKHVRASSPLCDCWHLFECFSQFSCQQLSHLSHSGSLFSCSTAAAGDTLTDCGSWWAGDEDKVEMESHVRSVEYTLCSFLWHNSTNL